MLYEMGPVSETTYPIPQISADRLTYNPSQTSVYRPVYRPFELPNPYLQNPPLSPSGIDFSSTDTLPPNECKLILIPKHTQKKLYFHCLLITLHYID